MSQARYRYYLATADNRSIFGFERLEAATAAALEMPVGAHLVDTLAQAYFPIVQEVRAGAGGKKELAYLPFGGWDTGRFGLDRDLIEGIKKGHPAIVHAYLAKGASADARDARGGTAMHWAAARGSEAIVRLLLRHGAAVDVLDAKGQSPLDVARQKGHQALSALLQARGSRSA